MNTTAKMDFLAIDDISISKTNPRTTFDAQDLEELAESIRLNGVLQSIVVRPKDGKYELVCGERRYRASKLIGNLTIPASIRELTDDEAFELQIVENLQRKDVHPMEEAVAYKRMLDSGRYDIPDIAAKVAKPEPFIAQRLKLNDLIDEIKDDFIHNVLSIGHAVKIARLDAKLQEGLVKNFKRRWDMQGWGTLKQLEQEIKTQSYDLGKAVFSLELGYGEIAPCAGCHFRSSTNPLLFADMQTDSCFNKPCYNGKVTAHLEAEAERILTEGSDVILVSLNNSNVPDSINTMADKLKKPVIRTAKDNQTANSLKKKAFVVGGSKAGQLIDVWIPKAAVTESGTVLSTADEINKIEERAVRMLELDQEKIHANIITSLKGEFGRNKLPEFNIDKDMLSALAWFVLMDSLSYDIRQQLKALKLPFRQDYASVEELHQDIAKLLPDQRKAMLTVILFEKYKGTLNAKYISGKIIRYLADANPNVSIKDIEAAQNEIAAARIARTDSRLAELRKKQDKPSKKESKNKGLLSVLGKKDNGLSALLNDKTK